jgi:hypothetical protein
MILTRIIFALLVPAQTQQPAKAITFDEPAGTADHILADLSKQAGIPLKTSPELSKEVLLISVKDVPTAELLKRIATVTAGQWLEQDSELRLVADQGAREQQRQTVLAQKTQVLTKALDDLRGKMTGQPPAPGTAPVPSGEDIPSDSVFSTKGIAELLVSELDPQTLAAMSKDDRLVLSDNPNAMQLKLPEIPSGKVDESIKEHNKMAAEMQKAKEQNTEQMPPGTEEIMEMMGTNSIYEQIPGPPTKVILSIEQPGGGAMMFGMGQPMATLRFYDANGKVTFTEQSAIPGKNDFEETLAKVTGKSDSKDVKEAPKGKKIEFSAICKEFKGLSLVGGMSTGKLPNFSADLKNRMLHPDQFDPLSFTASEALKAVAAEKQEQLIADLPDAVSDSFMAGRDEAVTTGEYLESVKDAVSLNEKSGWLQVTPVDSTASRLDRVDRKSLAILLASAQAKGLPSLDDMAAYAVANEATNLYAGVTSPYMLAYVPGVMTSMMLGGNDWKTLRLYGLMSPDQREVLRKGEPISYDGLTLEEKAIVQAMVYGGGASLQETRPNDQPKKNFFGLDFLADMLPMNMGQIQDFLQEPTECLPQGLTSSVVVQCAYSTSPVVRSADDDGFDTMLGALGPDEYSMIDFFKTQPMAANNGPMPKFAKFRVGTRATYNIKIQLRPNVFVKKKLIDDSVALDALVVTADNLPADFKTQVQARGELIKKSPFAKVLTMPRMPVSPP